MEDESGKWEKSAPYGIWGTAAAGVDRLTVFADMREMWPQLPRCLAAKKPPQEVLLNNLLSLPPFKLTTSSTHQLLSISPFS